jgi:hypothetical protein
MDRTDELAAEHLAQVEEAMRDVRDRIRAHDGDGEAQAIAAGEPLFRAVHALWGWAIATSARVDFLRDDMARVLDRLDRIDPAG